MFNFVNFIDRRKILKVGSLALLLGKSKLVLSNDLASIVAVRIWPSDEYSRITLESDKQLKFSHFILTSPIRLVVDIEGVELKDNLQEDLVAKIQADDPNILGIRVGKKDNFKIRLVIDLKQEITPQIFDLKPIEAYFYRLVLDLYPNKIQDSLTIFLAEQQKLANEKNKKIENIQIAENETKKQEDEIGKLLSKRRPTDKEINQEKKIAKTLPSLPRKRDIIIALDPGHGGEDPGAIGKRGTKEKDVVLKIAQILRNQINQSGSNGHKFKAFMTRDSDFFVPLNQRVFKAQKVKADLFISIHADAFIKPTVQGASVFALSRRGASSSAAQWLASKENNADLVGGFNVKNKDKNIQSALLDMSTTAQINDSLKLGAILLKNIGQFAKLHKSYVEQAGFAVLKAPEIPSILVETAFISNPQEEEKLRNPTYQRKIAEAILQGIKQYFAQNPRLRA